MKLSPQKELILSHLRSGEWVCGTAWLGAIKDDRRRIFELKDYMASKGYEIIGKPCDGRCGKTHSSTLFMRKAVRLSVNSAPNTAPINFQQHAKQLTERFDAGLPAEEVFA